MPHYADGTEAKVGDHVAGKLYNTAGVVAGTIVSITPGTDSCNAMVQYTRVMDPAELTSEALCRPREHGDGIMAVEWSSNNPPVPVHRVKPTQMHQSEGPVAALVVCADYCAVKELAKVG